MFRSIIEKVKELYEDHPFVTGYVVGGTALIVWNVYWSTVPTVRFSRAMTKQLLEAGMGTVEYSPGRYCYIIDSTHPSITK